MKPRFSVIISSIALVILVIVQLYNISVTFETKLDQFNTHYNTLVREALFLAGRTDLIGTAPKCLVPPDGGGKGRGRPAGGRQGRTRPGSAGPPRLRKSRRGG